jgi:hypothetical protein
MPKNQTIPGESEHTDQVLIFGWAEMAKGAYPELELMFAVPNGAKLPWKKDAQGRRFCPEAKKLKAEGLKAGVPDICLLYPVPPYHGFLLELKHGDNKPSPEQLGWIAALRSKGYCVQVAWGFEAAIETIKAYLEGRIEPC